MSQERKIRILCVEDEQEIRENIAEILRDEGFEVFEASDGKAGFESFLQSKPDLIISDIMMPEVDGYALLKLIREGKNIRNNSVPFIFLTALGQKDNIIKGVNLSANDYLVKPIDFDLMIAKIKEKTANALKVAEVQHRNISNIKSQISTVLSSDVSTYLDIITQTAAALKNQPYGPLPHRRYLEDFDKIYINSTKLRAAIANSLDSSVIDNKLNADEEIISAPTFLEEFVTSLSDKFKSRIKIEPYFEPALLPRVKIDRLVLLDALRKIFAGIFKTDLEANITVRFMIDHLDQMAIIFYLKTGLAHIDLKANLDMPQISKMLEQQSCRLELGDDGKIGVLVVPSYRLLK